MFLADFLTAMTVGFLGGVHCLGMCGGIVGAAGMGIKHPQKVIQLNFAYNAGRIVSYIFAGILAGGFGLLLLKTTNGSYVQNMLYVFASVMIILLGLYVSGMVAVLRFSESLGNKLWQYIEPWAQKVYPFNTIKQTFVAGTLWGFVPCGMVYGVLAWAATTGSPVLGAWHMLGFGLGTLPNLFLMGVFSHKLKPVIYRPKFKLVAGLIIVVYGVWRLISQMV